MTPTTNPGGTWDAWAGVPAKEKIVQLCMLPGTRADKPVLHALTSYGRVFVAEVDEHVPDWYELKLPEELDV